MAIKGSKIFTGLYCFNCGRYTVSFGGVKNYDRLLDLKMENEENDYVWKDDFVEDNSEEDLAICYVCGWSS